MRLTLSGDSSVYWAWRELSSLASQSSSIESGSSMCARKSESSMSHLTTGGTRKPRKSRFHADAYHARILSGSPLRTHLTPCNRSGRTQTRRRPGQRSPWI